MPLTRKELKRLDRARRLLRGKRRPKDYEGLRKTIKTVYDLTHK